MKKRVLTVLAIVLLLFTAIGCSKTESAVITKVQSTSPVSMTEAATKPQTTTAVSTTTETTTETNTEETTTTFATTAKKSTTKAKTAVKKTTKNASTKAKAENTCFITIDCSAALENMDKLKEGHKEFVPASGIILKKTKLSFKDSATAYDMLEKACKESGIKLTARDTIYGIYVSGINNLDEFDCGGSSGWVYTVNGKSPSVSCGKYEISSGDNIVFKYVC